MKQAGSVEGMRVVGAVSADWSDGAGWQECAKVMAAVDDVLSSHSQVMAHAGDGISQWPDWQKLQK